MEMKTIFLLLAKLQTDEKINVCCCYRHKYEMKEIWVMKKETKDMLAKRSMGRGTATQ